MNNVIVGSASQHFIQYKIKTEKKYSNKNIDSQHFRPPDVALNNI